MKLLMIVIMMMLGTSTPGWAGDDQAQQAPSGKGSVRVNDLPKPIPELLQKIQQLSSKIEPEISRIGSTLGQELKVTVKKLCDELQCQERPETK